MAEISPKCDKWLNEWMSGFQKYRVIMVQRVKLKNKTEKK